MISVSTSRENGVDRRPGLAGKHVSLYGESLGGRVEFII